MSKLLSKAAANASAPVPGAEILSKSPELIELFDLSMIAPGSDTGLRVEGLDAARVEDYAADMRANIENTGSHGFPAIVVVEDAGASMYWVARGNHRAAAALKAGLTHFPAQVYRGTRRDAVVLALGNNAEHGAKRTRADMQNEVRAVLTDPELGLWADTYIAKLVRCSRKTVADARAALVQAGEVEDDGTRLYVDKHGNTSKIQTKSIGANQPPKTPAKRELSDDEIETIIRTELARRVTSGRINDKIAWLLSHRNVRHYGHALAADVYMTDSAVLRVADKVRGGFEDVKRGMDARNEDVAAKARMPKSYVPAEPPVKGAEDGKGTTGATSTPATPEPLSAGATGTQSTAPAKMHDGKRLAELLELAMPLIEDFARARPEAYAGWANGNTVEDLTVWLYDLADLARSASK